VGAANFGIPGMLGKPKSVRTSAALTKTETTIVPDQPIFLHRQIKTAKTRTSKPNIFYASDGYSTALPIDYLAKNNIIIAYKMNNITIPPERGFPFNL